MSKMRSQAFFFWIAFSGFALLSDSPVYAEEKPPNISMLIEMKCTVNPAKQAVLEINGGYKVPASDGSDYEFVSGKAWAISLGYGPRGLNQVYEAPVFKSDQADQFKKIILPVSKRSYVAFITAEFRDKNKKNVPTYSYFSNVPMRTPPGGTIESDVPANFKAGFAKDLPNYIQPKGAKTFAAYAHGTTDMPVGKNNQIKFFAIPMRNGGYAPQFSVSGTYDPEKKTWGAVKGAGPLEVKNLPPGEDYLLVACFSQDGKNFYALWSQGCMTSGPPGLK